MFEFRSILRSEADRCRRRAAEATGVVRSLLLTAARRYDVASAEAVAAEHAEIQADQAEARVRRPDGDPG